MNDWAKADDDTPACAKPLPNSTKGTMPPLIMSPSPARPPTSCTPSATSPNKPPDLPSASQDQPADSEPQSCWHDHHPESPASLYIFRPSYSPYDYQNRTKSMLPKNRTAVYERARCTARIKNNSFAPKKFSPPRVRRPRAAPSASASIGYKIRL